jgi:hypothetical protein
MIVYLHGLNSAGTSAKAAWLHDNLPGITVLAPTYPAHRADEAPLFLRVYLEGARRERPYDPRLLLVGSSLGGFWAQYLAPSFGAGLVLINPSTRPHESLLRRVGPQRNEVTGERYQLTEDDVRAFARYVLPHCTLGVPTLLLLDQADEVIDYRIAYELYLGCGKTIIYPGGSHRFEHLPEAKEKILALYESLPGE